MKFVNNYDTLVEFDEAKFPNNPGGGGELSKLDHYSAHVYEDDNIYTKQAYFIATMSMDSELDSLSILDSNGEIKERIRLKKGENIIYGADYGFQNSYDSIIYGAPDEEYYDYMTSIDLSNYKANNITNMSYMFSWCYGLTSLDLSNFNTSNVTNMYSMFSYCSGLTSLDVSSFNTSKVKDMHYMFGSCSRLTSLYLSNFDTSNVTDMGGMFAYCSRLTSLDVSNFNTSNVTRMNDMFFSCSGLTSLDLSNFVTSNVTSMGGMFNGCTNLTSLNVINFNTSNVNSMGYMFSGCTSLIKITCKQAFKDWCITNQDTISLPTAMREGGSGTWEIVG